MLWEQLEMLWETATALHQVWPAPQYGTRQYKISQRAILAEIEHLFFKNVIIHEKCIREQECCKTPGVTNR